MRYLRVLIYSTSLLFFACLVAGYLGHLHPAFDSFSAFRLHFAALTLISSVALAMTGGWLGGVSFAAASAFVLFWAITPSIIATANSNESSAHYRLLQTNVRFNNPTPKELLRLIARTKPDVITAQEITPRWRLEFATIKAAYPYQLYCTAYRKIGDVAILSRRPFVEAQSNYCGEGAAIAIQSINFGGQILEVASLHLYWPWPHEQPRQVQEMQAILSTLGIENRRVIIAGDLNAPRWSHAARDIAAYSRTNALDYRGASWLPIELPQAWTRWIGLPIDNVFTNALDILNIQTQPNVGSDHLPVLLEFSIGASPTAGTNSPAIG